MSADLERAIEQFKDVMEDAFGNEPLTDEGTKVAVAALLAAGWKPPSTVVCTQCPHPLHRHDAGGCGDCGCSRPFGGR